MTASFSSSSVDKEICQICNIGFQTQSELEKHNAAYHRQASGDNKSHSNNKDITSTTSNSRIRNQQQQQQRLPQRRRIVSIVPKVPEPRSTLLLVGVTAGVLTAGLIAWYYTRRRREQAEEEL